MRLVNYILLSVIGFLGLVFATLNAHPVHLKYYIGVKDIPLSVIVLISVIIGIMLGWLVSLRSIFRLKRENKKINARATQAENEVENLRNIPIKDEH